MKISVLWIVVSCGLVDMYQYFKRTLMVKAACSFDVPTHINQTTQCHIPGDSYHQLCERCNKMKLVLTIYCVLDVFLLIVPIVFLLIQSQQSKFCFSSWLVW
jgi:hypothetical protein